MMEEYVEQIQESAKSGTYKTAHGIAPADMRKLTNRLRYLAGRLGLDIQINTDKQERTVSFIASPKGNPSSD